MFELLRKNHRDDDTESIFSGSLDECHAYAQGFTEALLSNSNYNMFLDESNITVFHSGLISEVDFEIWIAEVPSTVEENYNCPCIICKGARNGADAYSILEAMEKDPILV